MVRLTSLIALIVFAFALKCGVISTSERDILRYNSDANADKSVSIFFVTYVTPTISVDFLIQFLFSLRYHVGMFQSHCFVCTFGNNSYMKIIHRILTINNLLATVLYIDDYKLNGRNLSDSWYSIYCLSEAAKLITDYGSVGLIVSIKPNILFVNQFELISNLRLDSLYSEYDFLCITGDALGGICSDTILTVRSSNGYSLSNAVLNALEFDIDITEHGNFEQIFVSFSKPMLLRIENRNLSAIDAPYLILDQSIFTEEGQLFPRYTLPIFYCNNYTILSSFEKLSTYSPTVECNCKWPEINNNMSSYSWQLKLYKENHAYCLFMSHCLQLPQTLLSFKKVDVTEIQSPLTRHKLNQDSSNLLPNDVVKEVYIPKLYDIFLFFDEISMLRLRYEMLKDVVHQFILVESTHTFTGYEKPLYFNNFKHLLPPELVNRTLHIIVPPKHTPVMSPSDAWENEYHQRDTFTYLIDNVLIDLHAQDIVMLSDVDEIIRPSIVHGMVHTLAVCPRVLFLSMTMFYYNLSCIIETRPWMFGFAVPYGHLIQKYKNDSNWANIGQQLRIKELRHALYNLYPRAGWHLSYFKSVSRMIKKIEAFAHVEKNTVDVKERAFDRVSKGKSIVHNDDNEHYCRLPVELEEGDSSQRKEFHRLKYLWHNIATDDDTVFS